MSNIAIELTIEEKQALKALTSLQKKTKEYETVSTKSFKKSSLAFDVFAGTLVSNLAINGLSAIADKTREAYEEMKEFNKRLIEIETIMPKGQKVTKELKNELLQLSSTFAVGPQKQAQAYYQIISSGTTDTAKATELLTAANTVALGGIADLGGSINVLTDIMNIYGHENITANEAADALFQTVKLGKTDISQLSANMAQVLPSANELGISLDVVGASLATMTAQGLTTSERTTQLSALLNGVAKNGTLLGKSLDGAALRTKGLSQWLQDLKAKTGGSSAELFKLFGRTEAVKAVLALTAKDMKSLNGNIEKYEEKAGAAGKASDLMKKSLDFQTKQAEQNIKNLITALSGEAGLEAALVGSLELFNKLFEVIEKAGSDELKATNKIKQLTASINNYKFAIEQAKKSGRSEVLINQLKEKIALEQKELEIIQAKKVEEDKKKEEKNDKGGGLDPRVEQELRVQEELALIKEEAAIKRQELEILEREAKGEQTEADLVALRELENRKIEIEAETKIRKTESIKDSNQKEIELEKIKELKKHKLVEAQRKAEIKALKNFTKVKNQVEDSHYKAKMGLAQASGDAIIALTGDNQLAALALQKAFAVKEVFIQASKARIAAEAAAAAVAAASGPAAPATFAATKTAMFADIEATKYMSLGMIAAQSVASIARFETGGVIGDGNTSGDTTLVRANKKERVLTDEQNQGFEKLVDHAVNGSGGNLDIALLIDAINSRPVIVQIDGQEIARSVQNQILDGMEL
ncbi:MAG: phage tail tape measure protein [Bacteriovoracaceae bacterium]